LNFIKLESLCRFAKAVQQKLWFGLVSSSASKSPPELAIALETALLHY